MKRDLAALAERELDLVVVGAGVYGATAAWDAALRGLSVALLDRGDFGAETSFNSLKTIHGGLRYLQHGDFRRMRTSIRERRTLMRIAPHLVRPMPFLVPTRRDIKTSRLVLGLALLANDLVSFDRNRAVDADRILPRGRIVSREECLALAPGLDPSGVTGGVVWFDAHMHNSERLTFSFVRSAAEAGALVANHVEATGFRLERGRVAGVRARDRLSGCDLEIRSRAVLNASGPWVDAVLGFLPEARRRRLFPFSRAMNLVTRPLVEKTAVGFRAGSGFLFLVPWRGLTLVGTSHALHSGSAEIETSEEDVERLLADVNRAFPAAGLGREDVRLVHRGLLPVSAVGRNGRVSLIKRHRIEDHRREGYAGLVSIVGVKYTTARAVAERAIDQVFDILEKRPPPCRTALTPVWGGEMESVSAYLAGEIARKPAGLGEDVLRRLILTYGARYREVLAHGEDEPDGLRPLAPGSRVLNAEILHAVRAEQALDLESVVLRRTELGSAGHPGRSAVEAAAELVAGELGWAEEKTRQEIDRLEGLYRRRS